MIWWRMLYVFLFSTDDFEMIWWRILFVFLFFLFLLFWNQLNENWMTIYLKLVGRHPRSKGISIFSRDRIIIYFI